jgi:ParB family chromosome partitioning protein
VVRPKGLGKGLKALIPDVESQVGELTEVDVDLISPNPKQPRRIFDSDKLDELAKSIKENGIIQPLVVRKVADIYEIIAGERRWRAAKISGLTTLPVIIKAVSDADAMKIALLENLQREDLNPIEEAEAYRLLIEEHEMTQESLAENLGKSRSSISNSLRLLSLPVSLRNDLEKNLISMGHARALLGITDENIQRQLADRVISEDLSVREIESIVQRINNVSRETLKRVRTINPEISRVETALQTSLGTKVRIKISKDDTKGRIEIEYFSQDELNRLIDILIPQGM